jgi:hypothetical protein
MVGSLFTVNGCESNQLCPPRAQVFGSPPLFEPVATDHDRLKAAQHALPLSQQMKKGDPQVAFF